MNCCQCQGIEEVFNDKLVNKELARLHAKGPSRTTRLLIEALRKQKIQGLSLLDIGGGVGAIQYALLEAGCQSAIDVDASNAYIHAAREEAQRRGMAEKINYRHGNFVELAPEIPEADIVTLDRVICCFPDVENMVDLSAARAGRLYGLVFPRDSWWIRVGMSILNFILRLQRSSYRGFAHSTQAVEALVRSHGLKRIFYQRTLFWQIVVYSC